MSHRRKLAKRERSIAKAKDDARRELEAWQAIEQLYRNGLLSPEFVDLLLEADKAVAA